MKRFFMIVGEVLKDMMKRVFGVFLVAVICCLALAIAFGLPAFLIGSLYYVNYYGTFKDCWNIGMQYSIIMWIVIINGYVFGYVFGYEMLFKDIINRAIKRVDKRLTKETE